MIIDSEVEILQKATVEDGYMKIIMINLPPALLAECPGIFNLLLW